MCIKRINLYLYKMNKMLNKQDLIKLLIAVFCHFSISLLAQEQLTHLPTFYIKTLNNSPIKSKSDYLPAKLTIVSSNPTELFADSTNIRGRGNSTWGMAKKPYRLKLYEKYSLLNATAKEKKWTLLANYADKTLMRHAVAFKVSEFVEMEFTPTVRFVDLVLNNQILGSYLMSDQMEVAVGRVEVEKQKKTDVAEPNITGGYLIEVDGFAAGEPKHFYTQFGMPITVKYPKHDEINESQFSYIKNYVQLFEEALFSSDFTNPETGYRAYIDENSLINWYIASEFTGNSDAFWSTYIYKKRDNPKLFFGPLWDFDIAFNNDNRLGDATQKLMREDGHSNKTWIQQIWKDPWFQNAVRARWKELVDNGIEQAVIDYIDELEGLLEESQELNFNIWPILNNVVYREVAVFPTYKEGVNFLRNYISDRIDFLNKGFVSVDEEPVFPPFEYSETAYYQIISKKSGKVVDLSDIEDEDGIRLMHWEAIDGEESQHWRFSRTDDGFYNIMNRENGKAIKSLQNQGSNLVLVDLENSPDFNWEIVNTNVEAYYAIFNQASMYCFNNRSGGMENGNPLIEWNSNIYTSDNAKYAIVKVAEGTSNIDKNEIENIKIWMGPLGDDLRILPSSGIASVANIRIYTMSATQIMHTNNYQLGNSIDISSLVKGVYLIQIQTDNRNYSLKFIK